MKNNFKITCYEMPTLHEIDFPLIRNVENMHLFTPFSIEEIEFAIR